MTWLSLYSFLLVFLWPFVFLGFVWRFGLKRTLRGLGERFGAGFSGRASPPKDLIWIHAASIGEIRAVEPLLRRLKERFPEWRVGLTTTTVVGKELAEKLSVADEYRLAPVDVAFCVTRLLKGWNPRVLALVETELWPNWIQTAWERNVPILLMNGRISDRSFETYRLLKSFWSPLLGHFTAIGAQSPLHADRFVRLGADRDRVFRNGNLKYDVPLPDVSRRSAIFRKYGFSEPDSVWVCGSTHREEEEALIDVFRTLRSVQPRLKLVLAPRHVERSPDLGRALDRKGLSFRFRSRREALLDKTGGSLDADVLVLDTLGELPEAYGLARWAFVGGSLVPRGGQNPLEPARWGIPVLFGPHMENFREMAELFARDGAAVQVAGVQELESSLRSLLEDSAGAERLGSTARRMADAQRGAVDKNLAMIQNVLSKPLR